jgi:hypothetical protein
VSWRIVQYIAGVDAEAQRIILARWATWCAFIERWLSAFSDWDARLLLPERRADLRAYLDALSRSVLRVDYGVDDPHAYEARVKALRIWWSEYLLPLARALGIWDIVEYDQILYCLKRGWLKQPTIHPNRQTASDVQQLVVAQVRHIVASNDYCTILLSSSTRRLLLSLVL